MLVSAHVVMTQSQELPQQCNSMESRLESCLYHSNTIEKGPFETSLAKQEFVTEKCCKIFAESTLNKENELLRFCREPKNIEIIIKEKLNNPTLENCKFVYGIILGVRDDGVVLEGSEYMPLAGAIRCYCADIDGFHWTTGRFNSEVVSRILYNSTKLKSNPTDEECERSFHLMPKYEDFSGQPPAGHLNYNWVLLLNHCGKQPTAQKIKEYLFEVTRNGGDMKNFRANHHFQLTPLLNRMLATGSLDPNY